MTYSVRPHVSNNVTHTDKLSHYQDDARIINLAGEDGIEPSTTGLTVLRSAAELLAKKLAPQERLELPTTGFGDQDSTN